MIFSVSNLVSTADVAHLQTKAPDRQRWWAAGQRNAAKVGWLADATQKGQMSLTWRGTIIILPPHPSFTTRGSYTPMWLLTVTVSSIQINKWTGTWLEWSWCSVAQLTWRCNHPPGPVNVDWGLAATHQPGTSASFSRGLSSMPIKRRFFRILIRRIVIIKTKNGFFCSSDKESIGQGRVIDLQAKRHTA